MRKLILVKYNNYADGHITPEDRKQLRHLLPKLELIIREQEVKLAVDHNRCAEETGDFLRSALKLYRPFSFAEFYNKTKEGRVPNVVIASKFFIQLGDDVDCLVVVVSRAYIDTVPLYFVTTALQSGDTGTVLRLGDGRAYVIDCSGGFVPSHVSTFF